MYFLCYIIKRVIPNHTGIVNTSCHIACPSMPLNMIHSAHASDPQRKHKTWTKCFHPAPHLQLNQFNLDIYKLFIFEVKLLGLSYRADTEYNNTKLYIPRRVHINRLAPWNVGSGTLWSEVRE